MRGIASRFVVSSLLSSKPELGEPPETTLLLLALVWILMYWDCRRLHMSNTPIPSAIRMASMVSMLTRTHRCHPRTSTLIVMRKCSRMILFDGDKFCHWLIQSFTTWTTREGSIDRWCWNHNGNIHWTFWSGLLRNTQLGISLEVQRMVRRLVSILELGLGSIDLKGMTSVSL